MDRQTDDQTQCHSVILRNTTWRRAVKTSRQNAFADNRPQSVTDGVEMACKGSITPEAAQCGAMRYRMSTAT